MLTPAFHFEILKEYLEVFKEESDKLVSLLSEKEAKELNIVPIATQFTLNTICESAMGVKLSDLGNNGLIYRENIYKVGELLLFRLLRPWLRPNFMYSLLGYRKQLDEVLKPVLKFTESIVQQRKSNFLKGTIAEPFKETDENIYFRTKKRRYAMMDTLLQAENNGLIDDEGIIEETDTFTFEGHDTTSAAIIFTLLLLAHHPEAQETIFNEIEEQKNNFELSWATSVNETARLFEHFRKTQPHNTKETVTLNSTRLIIIKLAKPLAEISQNIQTNISVLNDRMDELNNLDIETKNLNLKLKIPQVDLKTEDLPYPTTVCADQKCLLEM